ncbi:hypothetical protein Ga0074812_1307 [Parafrankia irregularis]|uniref:Uncharacterized protein n=1 Tax=Parafrankia irregularis TaxID=795642 RepID=A0A0S4QV93_9ACTN|nr:hypothetical protein Ga0074812_1307 [Parafrankia irregularis]
MKGQGLLPAPGLVAALMVESAGAATMVSAGSGVGTPWD